VKKEAGAINYWQSYCGAAPLVTHQAIRRDYSMATPWVNLKGMPRISRNHCCTVNGKMMPMNFCDDPFQRLLNENANNRRQSVPSLSKKQQYGDPRTAQMPPLLVWPCHVTYRLLDCDFAAAAPTRKVRAHFKVRSEADHPLCCSVIASESETISITLGIDFSKIQC
jgi:hypothetical protein